MPYLASAGGYNLTPIAPLASVLQRGAARSRSNDATVALNNVLRDNFNAEKQMALNALTAMDNKYRADLTDKRLRDLSEEKRKSEQRAALAQVAMGGSSQTAPQETDLRNDLLTALKFNQSTRNAAYNELDDYGINLKKALGQAVLGIPAPKSKTGSTGTVTITRPIKTTAERVNLPGYGKDTNDLFEFFFKSNTEKK